MKKRKAKIQSLKINIIKYCIKPMGNIIELVPNNLSELTNSIRRLKEKTKQKNERQA